MAAFLLFPSVAHPSPHQTSAPTTTVSDDPTSPAVALTPPAPGAHNVPTSVNPTQGASSPAITAATATPVTHTTPPTATAPPLPPPPPPPTEASSAPAPGPHKQSPAQPLTATSAPSTTTGRTHRGRSRSKRRRRRRSRRTRDKHHRSPAASTTKASSARRRRRRSPSTSSPPLQMAAHAAALMHPLLSDPINSLHTTARSQTCPRQTFPTFQHYDAPTALGNYLHHIFGAFLKKTRSYGGSISTPRN